MNNKPTPETDAETMRDEYDHVDSDLGPFAPSDTVTAEFARKLERERDEAREALRTLAEHGEKEMQRLTKERDEAREEIEALRHEYHGAKAMAGGFKDKIKSLTEQRDEAREAMREAWLACMRVDVRLALVEWRNKHASILEEVK